MRIKKKYLLLSLFLYLYPIMLVFAEDEENNGKLKLHFLYVVSVALQLIRIIVPAVLIVKIGIDIFKMVSYKDESELYNLIKTSSIRIVAAVAIFFLPIMLSLLLSIIRIGPNWNEYSECIANSSKCEVELTDPEEVDLDVEIPELPPDIDPPEIEEEEGAPSIVSVDHKSAFVTVKARKGDSDIAGYYFATNSNVPSINDDRWVLINNTTLEIAKIPGQYLVYVKDSQGRLSSPSSLTITYDDLYNDGPRSRNQNAYTLYTKLDSYLFGETDSIENMDSFIFNSVKSAGLFTKEGVVTAGIAGPNYLLYKHGINIPYISNHQCFSQRYNVYFGSNPNWGKPITMGNLSSSAQAEANKVGLKTFCKGDHGGLDCASFVGWSIHNGGFKAENTAGSYVGTNKASQIKVCASYDGKKCIKLKSKDVAFEMYAKAQMGDQISNNAHVMLIIGTFNNGIYVYEGTTPVGMAKYTYDWLYKNEYYALTQMEGYYSHSSNYACNKNSSGKAITIPKEWSDKASLFRNCEA